MNPGRIREILDQVASGQIDVEQALESLRTLPFRDLGFAKLDHHRELRSGLPEVVFAPGKSLDHLLGIVANLDAAGESILVTRLEAEPAALLCERIPALRYEPLARLAFARPLPQGGRGAILVAAAGTADLPVAEEAALTAEFFGNRVRRVYDVGVAGIQRLFAHCDELRGAAVVIVVAGMEGALPSVVGGIVDRPLIAVPTAVGYGASFGGLAALLAMLNSCAAGVVVVNIDNGFGAAVAAHRINRAA